MNIILFAIIIIIILALCTIKTENFALYARDPDSHIDDLLYTYDMLEYPFYIKPYLRNTKLLQLAEPADQTGSVFCKDCTNLRKEHCGLCRNCGWCINQKGEGKCVPGDKKGPHFHSDCDIWRHPYHFGKFRPAFSGRIFPNKIL